ncbi:MAG: hypothetical protein ABI451_12340 [Dokdonella sp.]
MMTWVPSLRISVQCGESADGGAEISGLIRADDFATRGDEVGFAAAVRTLGSLLRTSTDFATFAGLRVAAGAATGVRAFPDGFLLAGVFAVDRDLAPAVLRGVAGDFTFLAMASYSGWDFSIAPCGWLHIDPCQKQQRDDPACIRLNRRDTMVTRGRFQLMDARW